jgi:hypothetical protein
VLEAAADTASDSIIEVAEDCGATAAAGAAGADAPACAAAALSTAAEPDAAVPMAVEAGGDEIETACGGEVGAAAAAGRELGVSAAAGRELGVSAAAGTELGAAGGAELGVRAAGGGRLPFDGKGAPPFAAGAAWRASLLRPVLFATWRSVPAKSLAPCAAVPESAVPAPAGACGFEGAALVDGAAGALKFGIVAFMP